MGKVKFVSLIILDVLKLFCCLSMVKEVSWGVEWILSWFMNEFKVDYFVDFDYLNEYEVFVGDGYFIEYVCYIKIYDIKVE